MPRKDRNVEEEEAPNAEEADEGSSEAAADDPHAGLVKMKRDDKVIHAHPTAVAEHIKNGWKHA
jgi:hypothetical protein